MVVKEDDAGLASRNFASACLFGGLPDEVAAIFVEVSGGHGEHQGFTVKGLGLVLQAGVGDEDAGAAGAASRSRRGIVMTSADGASAPPLPQSRVVVWDTLTRLGEKLEPLARESWKPVPSDLLALESNPAKASSDPGYYGREYTFRGDAVVETPEVLAVFSSAKGRVALYSRGSSTGAEVTPIADCSPISGGTGANGIARVEVVRNAAGSFRLFRVGDAVASRNIHAAIFDSLRLAKDI